MHGRTHSDELKGFLALMVVLAACGEQPQRGATPDLNAAVDAAVDTNGGAVCGMVSEAATSHATARTSGGASAPRGF